MPVRAVTPLVEPHHIVIVPRADSDALNYDAARDELAVGDPYELEWEPVLHARSREGSRARRLVPGDPGQHLLSHWPESR
jgi:hypothetical protein